MSRVGLPTVVEEGLNEISELPVEAERGGRPISVTVSADLVGDERTIMEDLRRFLIQRVRQRVLEHFPLNGERVLPYVRGFLTATNLSTGSQGVASTNNGEAVNETNYQNISLDEMTRLSQKLAKSDERLDQVNIEWTFQILWPENLREMVGAKVRPPSAFLKDKKDPWIRLWNTPDDLSCLAYTLVHMVNHKHLFDTKTRNGLETARKKTLKLMEKMGWEKYVNLYEGCAAFILEHPKYEIVILEQHSLKSGPIRVYTGSEFNSDMRGKNRNRLYLFHDIQNNHVAGSHFLAEMCKRFYSHNWQWCNTCHKCFNRQSVIHVCGGEDQKFEKEKIKICPKCNETTVVGEHNCPLISCKTCQGHYYKREMNPAAEMHRCFTYRAPSKEEKQKWNTLEEPDGKTEAAMAYDFETFIKRVPCPRENIEEFNYDENGFLVKGSNGYVKQTVMEYHVHVVNWISCTDMMTRVTKVFRYDENDELQDPLKRFTSYVTCEYNKGFNTLVAHNAKSYDAILLAKYLYDNYHGKGKNVKIARRGRKIMEIKLSQKGSRHTTRFIDSLSHCPGSLASLYQAFTNGELSKGYYPYSFNSPENYGYVGPLPDKKYFGVYERAKNKQEIEKFEKWWEQENLAVGNNWNYRNESEKYCVEDTEGLARVMKIYHDICMDKFKLSPWKHMTGPKFRHSISLELITKLLFDEYQNKTGEDLWEMQKDDPQRYATIITELAKTETWAVLKSFEYAAVRKAMRGGRTECFQMYAGLTQDEINAGVRYRHVDITSSYPAQQIRQKFPVGIPDIRVYDPMFAPCVDINCRNSVERTYCNHPEGMRNPQNVKYVKLYAEEDQPTEQKVLDEEWEGYVCVTLQPCKMPIMLIGVFDEKSMKNVYTAERIEKLWIPCCTFLTALKWGYKLIKVHAWHRYKIAESLFRDDTLPLFIQKTANGRSNPTPEERESLAQLYDEKFDQEFGDAIRDSGEWRKNGAVKMVYKILLNCGWGKHAQKPRLNETKVLREESGLTEMNALLDNVVRGTRKVTRIENVGTGVRTFEVENTDSTEPDLHDTYLPAAAMVPAFGQLQLWNEMNRIERSNIEGGGRRVLYCDTDSIIYKWYPESFGVYNVPEHDDLLGGWTREDPPAKDGIYEFAAVGPKTYSYKYGDGSLSSMKTKGVTVCHASSKILNFETVKKHVQTQMKFIREDKDKEKIRKVVSIGVPQTNFFVSKTDIVTHKSIKKIGINLDDMKGVMLESGELVPFGYDDAVEQELVMSSWKDYSF
jgi:hypothetical protein